MKFIDIVMRHESWYLGSLGPVQTFLTFSRTRDLHTDMISEA